MKADNMLKKIKELLNIEAQVEKVELEQATLENGTVIESENFEVGSEVFIVTEDEKVALPVGKYTLEDGEKLIIKEEGIIASIGEEKEEEPKEEASEENLNTDNMDNKEVVQEVQENLEEDKKEEMQYATKEELASLKKDIEEIKGMIDKMGKHKEEEMSAEDKPIEEKEELSAVEKVKHNPEKEVKTEPVFMSRRGETTFDRVMRRINNI